MGGRGGGIGGVSNANAGVPASKRKVVQSLKEIVNCSELEIYAMLVECDMDPDEAVSRLLSQDTFHEVKSKRDKKKETKDPADSWTRNIPNRGARSFNDSYNTSRGGGNKYNSNETGNSQGIPPNRRENGARNHWTGSSLSSGVLGRQPPSNSVPASSEVKKAPIEPSETVTSSSLPTPAYQSAWVNANPGQKTLAEIVKMGTPKQQKNVVLPRSSEAQESGSKAPLKDEWPSIEKQDVSYPSANAWKPSAESKMSAEQFSESQHLDETHLDDHHQEAKTNEVGSPPDADNISPASVSSRNLLDDDSRESSVCEDENNNKAERHSYEENGDEDVSASVATGFQQLTIDNEEEQEALPKEDKACGSGQASGLNDNLDEPLEPEDDSSFRHPETNFYGEEEEQLRNATTNDQASYQIDSSARNYQSATDSETEAVQHEPPQEGHQYKFSSSADYGFENSQLLNPPSETNPQMQNLDTFPNVMQGYTSSLPNTLLPSGIQDPRESDLHYSPFQTKYNTATPSSLSGPSISMAEALRAANMSPQNAMPSAGQQAAALAQHIALNPYTHQPGMALGPYGNLISYPFMPQSYNPYLASGFQQFPAGNHQSLPGMLPQYKTQATAPSAPMPSAYGFGGGAASSNNFPLNPTSAANSYEDVLNSQFKDSNHLAASLQQQNENSAAWHQGQQPNSRVVPGSGYYSFPGLQNQQPPGFRQPQQLQQQQQQQPSQQQQQQHFGGHGYVSPYHSQAGMSLEQLHHQHQQQQNARDASKQNQQQLWPNNY
ncbi:GBF-interacting protein 1 [Cardamine amara subsp. amara]|uniref:GBF-interacting protein 1 n=1 Tax=Cardamine amara subsp. amara TaxID=228776 RepID=A0ABD1A9V2_CARAN